MANHLLIGLGGTSGGILNAFHKKVNAEHGDMGLANTHLDFIYVDSSEADLAASPLRYNQKVNIHGISGNVLANLAHYSGMIGEQDASAKLLDVNILDKLYQEDYPSTEMLQKYLATLAAKTECFLKTNGAEMSLGDQQYQELLHIAVLKHAKRDEFIETFRRACFGGSFTPESAAFNDRGNEIVIIRVASKILLRYLQNVVYMKGAYNKLTSETNPKSKLNRVLLHTESLSDEQMPDLYLESPVNQI